MSDAVFLIGYRASGKTTVGLALARRLGCGFVDTDRLVEEDLRATTSVTTIAQCFTELGEAAFRSRETVALRAVCQRIDAGERLVVATGGGMVLAPHNVELLRAHGQVVWLSAGVETLVRRLQGDSGSVDSRPALTAHGTAASEIGLLLALREPKYRATAHLEVSTEGRDPEAIAAAVDAAMKR